VPSPADKFEFASRKIGAYLRRNPAFFDGLTPVLFIYSRGYTMATDSKHHLTILAFKTIDYRNKKTNAPEQMKLAQCVVRSKSEVDGKAVESTLVGELLMPKAMNETLPGEYLAEFELSVGQDLRIGSRLTALHPLRQPVTARAAEKA
jgi:hypothetical protein